MRERLTRCLFSLAGSITYLSNTGGSFGNERIQDGALPYAGDATQCNGGEGVIHNKGPQRIQPLRDLRRGENGFDAKGSVYLYKRIGFLNPKVSLIYDESYGDLFLCGGRKGPINKYRIKEGHDGGDKEETIDICGKELRAFLVASPLLLAAVAAGTVTSMFQSVLRVHDTTPLLIARLVVTGAALVALMPWLLDTLQQFAQLAWGTAPIMGY